MAKKDLTADRVRELLDYEPETGVFTWKPRPAGHRRSSGYVSIHIDGCEIKAHQLVWFLAYGAWPETLIDHINGNPSDNRLKNLRDGSSKLNAENQRRAKATNQAKLLGVSWHKKNAKWQAGITANGKKYYLGTFDTAEEAHAVYLEAKRRFHEGCSI
ncbi:HNH endonuclease [Cupriavidus basilensis]|uniref:HNH endonuclease n=1 Tax=Cupriavidus basilensis TaxID=68895 RepID=UPI0018CF9612|nr:HNH endonuclease [Cupriavidus basilensis]